jgi:hypothetical protein
MCLSRLTTTARNPSRVQRVRELRTFIGVDADTYDYRPTRHFLLTLIGLHNEYISRL